MANSDKNILITPATGTAGDPTIVFTGTNATPITQRILDAGTVSFQGSSGELLSISNGLTGTIFSVNDISGIPSIEVLDTGMITLAKFGGNVGVGADIPTAKLTVSALSNPGSGVFAGGTPVLRLSGAVGSGFAEPKIEFGEGYTKATAEIASKNSGNGGGSLIFITRDTSSLTSTLTERMRIDPVGNVGIGTISPVGRFNVVTPVGTQSNIAIWSGNQSIWWISAAATPGNSLSIGGNGGSAPASGVINIDTSGKTSLSAVARDTTNQVRNITFSTSAASSGQDGDVWIQYTA